MENEIILQAFYWEMCTDSYKESFPEECNLWNLLAKKASKLKELGFSSVWIPPATKGYAGIADVGYGVYDLWDLGEFEQKGAVRTKYGSKEDLIKALDSLHKNGIKVYFDAVLNHRFGADEKEIVKLKDGNTAEVWTKFNFPGRGDKYSDYKLNWQSFDGTDWNERTKEIGRYLFKDKDWDSSHGEDFLMGADLDYNNKKVTEDVINWGKWIIKELGFDGFRIDGAKHIDNDFLRDFITSIQQSSDKKIFFAGEAWYEDERTLLDYIQTIDTEDLKVFDYPLRKLFVEMKNQNLDMNLLKDTGIVNTEGYKNRACTFVDTHDTDRDESEENIESISHYKYQAYTYILLREEGIPVVYWKDFFIRKMDKKLKPLIKAKNKYAGGKGYESEATDQNTYCYVREGDKENTGLVMLITEIDNNEVITKKINSRNPNTEYYDITGNIKKTVKTDEKGFGYFSVFGKEAEGFSVWVIK